MQAVSRLCSRAIWLNEGVLRADGHTNEVVGEYLHEQTRSGAERHWPDSSSAPGNEVARLRSVRALGEDGEIVSTFTVDSPVLIEVTYEMLADGRVAVPFIQLNNDQGVCVFVSHDWNGGWRDRPRPQGVYTSTAMIPPNLLAEGIVFVSAGLTTHQPFIPHFNETDAITFRVVENDGPNSARGDLAGSIPGVVRPILEWKTDVTEAN
jgi:lipopolysaccharide transport system ATP-binding protein